MRVGDATVFWVTFHTSKRKGRLFLVERYNGHYYKGTQTVAGPILQDELAAAVAARTAYWNGIGKLLTPQAIQSLAGVAK